MTPEQIEQRFQVWVAKRLYEHHFPLTGWELRITKEAFSAGVAALAEATNQAIEGKEHGD